MARSFRHRSRRHTKRHQRQRQRKTHRRRHMRGGFGPGSTITGTNGPNSWGTQPSDWPGVKGDLSGTYLPLSSNGIPSGAFQPPVPSNGPLNTTPYPPSLYGGQTGGKGKGTKSKSRRHMRTHTHSPRCVHHRYRRGGGGISLVDDGRILLNNISNSLGNVLRGFQGVTPSISASPTDQPIAREQPLINAAPQAPIDFAGASRSAAERVNALA